MALHFERESKCGLWQAVGVYLCDVHIIAVWGHNRGRWFVKHQSMNYAMVVAFAVALAALCSLWYAAAPCRGESGESTAEDIHSFCPLESLAIIFYHQANLSWTLHHCAHVFAAHGQPRQDGVCIFPFQLFPASFHRFICPVLFII